MSRLPFSPGPTWTVLLNEEQPASRSSGSERGPTDTSSGSVSGDEMDEQNFSKSVLPPAPKRKVPENVSPPGRLAKVPRLQPGSSSRARNMGNGRGQAGMSPAQPTTSARPLSSPHPFFSQNVAGSSTRPSISNPQGTTSRGLGETETSARRPGKERARDGSSDSDSSFSKPLMSIIDRRKALAQSQSRPKETARKTGARRVSTGSIIESLHVTSSQQGTSSASTHVQRKDLSQATRRKNIGTSTVPRRKGPEVIDVDLLEEDPSRVIRRPPIRPSSPIIILDSSDEESNKNHQSPSAQRPVSVQSPGRQPHARVSVASPILLDRVIEIEDSSEPDGDIPSELVNGVIDRCEDVSDSIQVSFQDPDECWDSSMRLSPPISPNVPSTQALSQVKDVSLPPSLSSKSEQIQAEKDVTSPQRWEAPINLPFMEEQDQPRSQPIFEGQDQSHQPRHRPVKVQGALFGGLTNNEFFSRVLKPVHRESRDMNAASHSVNESTQGALPSSSDQSSTLQSPSPGPVPATPLAPSRSSRDNIAEQSPVTQADHTESPQPFVSPGSSLVDVLNEAHRRYMSEQATKSSNQRNTNTISKAASIPSLSENSTDLALDDVEENSISSGDPDTIQQAQSVQAVLRMSAAPHSAGDRADAGAMHIDLSAFVAPRGNIILKAETVKALLKAKTQKSQPLSTPLPSGPSVPATQGSAESLSVAVEALSVNSPAVVASSSSDETDEKECMDMLTYPESPHMEPEALDEGSASDVSERRAERRRIVRADASNTQQGYICGVPILTWASHVRMARQQPPKYLLAKDIPHSLQDRMNYMREEYRKTDQARLIYEAAILENTMDDEPHAPPIGIFNEIDDEVTPPWEFHYSNEMWYGDDIPPPDIENLESCDCTGGCDPKSKTCVCLKRQRKWLEKAVHEGLIDKQAHGFLYNEHGRLQLYDYPIFECNEFCGCDDDCRNRVIQNGRQCTVNIVKTKDKGWGVFAGPKKIYSGTYLGKYSGELLTEQVGEMRGHVYNKFGRTYLFDIDFDYLKEDDPDWENQFVVDAYHVGNFTRFLNHSCDPNCSIEAAYVNEANIQKPFLTVFTKRDVEPYEELSFSYSGYNEDSPSTTVTRTRNDAVYMQCQCGAHNCTGIMFN